MLYARRLEAENTHLKEELEEAEEENEDEDDESPLVSRLSRKINREASFEFDSLEEAVDFLLESKLSPGLPSVKVFSDCCTGS